MKKSLLLLISICGLCLLNGCGVVSVPTSPPPVLTHFSVTPSIFAPTAGTAFNVTVTALDASNSLFSSYAGTVHFSSSDGQAMLPASAALTGGAGVFSVTLKTAGPQTISATDANSIMGISNSIPVSAGAATRFSITAPTTASTGIQFTITVTAFDAFSNIATGYSGMVRFKSNDGLAALPPDSILPNGTGVFTVTLKTTPSATITATDTVASSLTGGSSPISVVSNAATHFLVSTLTTATTRAPIYLQVKALDVANNIAAGYSGTIRFKSTDLNTILPGDALLPNGIGSFTATLENAGSQKISVTDTITSSITGTSDFITVSDAAPLAISAAPPNGTFATIYGPLTTEYLRCAYYYRGIRCTPCSGASLCTALPSCSSRIPYHPSCVETIQTRQGFPLTATGGVPPYSWTATGLPPGLALTANLGINHISGTPTLPGPYNISVTVTDSGNPQVSTPVSIYPIVINDPAPPVIGSTPAPPYGAVNVPYSFIVPASSAAPPLTWRLTPGSSALPPGLTISQGGVLSGTPTAAGAYPITLIAEDFFKQDSVPQVITVQIFAHGFRPVGGMANSRSAHTATLLNTGKILVAGGLDANGIPLASAELYDPTTRTFSTTGSMGTARSYFAAALLPSGNVLVTGGLDTNRNPIAIAEIYDPIAGTFSATTGQMTIPRASHTATLLNTGKVLVTGWDNGFAELFNPSTGTFTATGSMIAARVQHTATLLKNGKVLITGGIGATKALLLEAELYDPSTGSFSVTSGSMATARQWHAASLLADGKVLVTGGLDNSSKGIATAELFDPNTQLFTATNGPMAAQRFFHAATVLQDGTVLVSGGNDSTQATTSAEIYDPVAGTFSHTGSMGTGREIHTATRLNDGTVLVTGGGLGSGGALSTAELYQ